MTQLHDVAYGQRQSGNSTRRVALRMEQAAKLFEDLSACLKAEEARLKEEREQLRRDITQFEAMKAKIATVSFPNPVRLNIGGTMYATSLEVLRKEKGSMLEAMFSGNGFKVEPQPDGAYFIDRDGAMFRYIINYLRSGKIYIPEQEQELDELREEVDFYQIASYQKELEFKEFRFASVGDSNGYLHWLGTKQGKQQWTNPHEMLSVTAVKGAFWASPASVTTRRGSAGSERLGMCTGGDGVAYSIRVPHPIKVTAYSAAWCGNCHGPRHWRFEGSADGVTWTTLKEHVNDTALSALHVSSAPKCTHFRWMTTPGGDSGGNKCFCLHMGAIELYGVVQALPSLP